MLAKEIKPGTVVNHNDAPHIIESVAVQSPSARGSATLYKFRARNLVTKQKTDITLKGTEGLDDAD
ncbi:MAG: translation elongation factor EF-P, partial [Pirellulales bacterium]